MDLLRHQPPLTGKTTTTMEPTSTTPTEQNQTLVFAVNGERFELSSIDPSTTLLQFLRSQTRFKSVKLGCGEGLLCNLFY